MASSTVYFGYGSNMWQAQMRARCPTSKYLGIARLKGYKWIIYERGYANVVKLPESVDVRKDKKPDYTHEVWGLVYSLQEDDEKRLDGNEGVPIAYQKESIECEFWPAKPNTEDRLERHGVTYELSAASHPNIGTSPTKQKMLVYINHKLVKESSPKEEYIYRMNQGIHDALEEGIPSAYVQQVMRRFIPEQSPEAVQREAER